MFTSRLRLLTAGESHGPELTGILDGIPAGLALPASTIDCELARRQLGFGAGARMQIERDHARITAGVMAGRTTGAPIALTIHNRDHQAWANRDIAPMTIPRPGHADLTAALKYGYRDLRLGLERASARETAMRVAAGAICRAYLAEFGIRVGGYVTRIGDVVWLDSELPTDHATYTARFAAAEANDLRCPDAEATVRMRATIEATIAARDTAGGVVEVVVLGCPPGLGSHVQMDRRLDARLAGALMSAPAVKGVEIGLGFAGAALPGTRAHDAIEVANGMLHRQSNRAGGLEGGISNGMPLVVRAALKPIATTLTPQRSVDLSTGQAAPTRYERSDFCQVPRAVPIAEALVAMVVADALLDKLGGDSLEEQRPRFAALRGLRVGDLAMDRVWRFGYEPEGDRSQ